MARDVVGVVVGLEDVLDAHAHVARELEVVVDLEARVDHGGHAGVLVADEIRRAAEIVVGDLAEDHAAVPTLRVETPSAMTREEERVQSVGEEPDARFSMANERTFLAWIRTAIALMVAGLAVAEFFDSRSETTRLAIALPLVLLGAAVAFTSYGRWEDKERAMRLGEALPASSTPRLIAIAVGIVAVVAAVLAVIDS